MRQKNAVDWHSSIAAEFDSKYSNKKQFIERYGVWESAIGKYSSGEKHVIDAGCGSGIFSFYACKLNNSVVGLDGSESMIKLCKEKASNSNIQNITFKVSEFNDMPNSIDEKSDITICSSVLEYIPNLEKSLELLNSMTKSGGIILISMPNRSSIYRKLEAIIFKFTRRPKYYAFVQHVVTVKQMKDLLVKCGMKPLEHQYFSRIPILSWVLGAIGLSKFSNNLFLIAVQCN